MRLWPWVAGGVAAGAATLVYGCLVGSKQLVVSRYDLRLPGWPISLAGFRLVVMADFHLRGDIYSRELTDRAVAMALGESPDMVALVGDYVAYWKMSSPAEVGDAFSPLKELCGRVVAVPGNHDYWSGDAGLLKPIFDELDIVLLRNENVVIGGIRWVGIDSAIGREALPSAAFEGAGDEPTIVLWHEPDAVDLLPRRADLMVAGHSHGGQFSFPGGFTPMHTVGGKKYPKGFYPDAPTPLFVTRGVGTTGPPSRLNCKPEVAVLEIFPA